MGNWVYGCDICQDICPWERFAPEIVDPMFVNTSVDRAAPLLTDLLGLTETSFQTQFAGTAIHRIRRERLVRNACIASGNSGSSDLIDRLVPLLEDPGPIVRGHAAWALGRLSQDAVVPLSQHLVTEEHPVVRTEIVNALAMITAERS
jgi:epoxyqueuosine reductase